jgi:hypothetical protein
MGSALLTISREDLFGRSVVSINLPRFMCIKLPENCDSRRSAEEGNIDLQGGSMQYIRGR